VLVFAIQGEGISIPSHQKLKELATPQGKVKMSYRQISMIFTIVFIAIVGWLIREFIAQPEGPQIASLAVLPLSNLTGNPDQEYFVTGMHNALINELSKISSLRIISRQSTLQFQGSTLPMKDIAKQLRVDAIVEGSVLQSWNHVQIQVQLIKVLPKESNILANTYDCELSDVLNIYRDITKDITDKVYVQLTAGEKAKLQEKVKITPEAYEAYLKGMFHWYKLTPKDLDLSENYFKLSQKLDSGFALAYVGLAIIGIGRMQMGYIPWTETFPVSLKNLNKALELDSTLSEAYYTSAFINDQSWNFFKAEQEYKKALHYNSNDATARAYYGHFLYRMKRPEEGQQEMDYALKLDPLNTLFKAMYGMGLTFNKQYNQAQELLEGIQETSPDSRIGLTTLRTLYHLQKKYEIAFLIWKKTYSNDPEAIEALDKGYQEGGYSKALQRLAEKLIERSKTKFVTPWQIATIYTRAGMKKEALEWLEKAYNAHDPNMPSIYVDPIFDYLRDERGFKSLYDKMNFPN
jgi:TolB-like protein